MNVARQSESIALERDAWHLRTDVYTSLGVFFGLILIRLTGITVFDPFFALGVAFVILKAAYDLTKRSLSDFINHSIPPAMSSGSGKLSANIQAAMPDFTT